MFHGGWKHGGKRKPSPSQRMGDINHDRIPYTYYYAQPGDNIQYDEC